MLTGTIVYNLGNSTVLGLGITFLDEELDMGLDGPITDIVFDVEEIARITALIESIPDTSFNPETIKRILSSQHIPENWRVGEAIAEAYLIENHQCHFPWPDGRDERKAGSSLPGSDLVGFHLQGTAYRFVFGEVKTSSDRQNPPGAIYGRTGLKKQIEDLKDDEEIRDGLVKYLAHRAEKSTWYAKFIESFTRYVKNSKDIQIFGILVRDVPPHQDDLRVRAKTLERNCSTPMSIFLYAFYLPENRIPTLSPAVVRSIHRRSRT